MFSSRRRDLVTSAPVAYSQSSGRLLAMHRPHAGLLPSHLCRARQWKVGVEDEQIAHTAFNFRHGKQAAPLVRGLLEDSVDMLVVYV